MDEQHVQIGTESSEADRNKLLLQMYDQLYSSIHRQFEVIWQGVGVLVGAFAVFSLAEKQIITIDWAAALIVVIVGWLWAHLLDASYWYNRNLAIVTNIERQFLRREDLRSIHYYFGQHRPNNEMIMHLRIQSWFGVGIVAVVLGYHFLVLLLPDLLTPAHVPSVGRVLPYVVLAAVLTLRQRVKNNRDQRYSEFLRNSPGKPVDTTGIVYSKPDGVDRAH